MEKATNRFWSVKGVLVLLALLMSGTGASAATTFIFNELSYSVNPDGKSVTVEKGNVKGVTTLIIPDYAYDANGTAYAVTAVKENSFRNFGKGENVKVVIGDNVTAIGSKAFEHFGESGGCTLLLGKGMTSLDDKAFEHFGESGGCSIYMKAETPPAIVNHSFEHVKNSVFYVKNESIKDTYLANDTWKKTGTERNNMFACFPYEMQIKGGRWVTAMFPSDISQEQVISYFGKSTLLATVYNAGGTFDGNSLNIDLQSVDSIKANTPYFIKIGNKEYDYVDDTPLKADASNTAESQDIDGYIFSMTGASEEYNLKQGELYFRNSDGKLTFHEATGNGKSFVSAGKCWFGLTSTNGNARPAGLAIGFNGMTTAIRPTVNGNVKNDSRIYTTDGVKANTQPGNLKKGLYIIYGKKVLVK